MILDPNTYAAARNQRLDPLHPILEAAGCVFEEKLGWERPGWFSPNRPAPIKSYDFYGAYNFEVHEDYEYRQLLTQDYRLIVIVASVIDLTLPEQVHKTTA